MVNKIDKLAPKSSLVPLSPTQLPQQKINLVTPLPPRPNGFCGHVDWIDGLQKDRPRGTPRKVERLCSVEWAWSPNHNRIDTYYINEKPTFWALWRHNLDDGQWPWKWTWQFYAYGPKSPAEDIETIATYLLLDAWSAEVKEGNIDHYHWINEEGLLDTKTIREIAREVWGGR